MDKSKQPKLMAVLSILVLLAIGSILNGTSTFLFIARVFLWCITVILIALLLFRNL